MKFTDILSTEQFKRSDIELIMKFAAKFEPYAQKKKQGAMLAGKIMASLFYEPSTRTRLSFETAMKRLGGDVITAVGMEYSSIAKGETLADTARTIEKFADVIVVRHPLIGSAREMAEAVKIPVINAGDGAGEHPTQALLDIYTIKKERGKIDGLTIAMVGDLKHSRTIHSFVNLLRHYDVKLIFVAPDELKIPKEYLKKLDEKRLKYEEISDLRLACKKSDVIYMTRIQKERFSNLREYEQLKNSYVMSRGLIEKINPKAIVMHPLPRVGEISLDMDDFKGSAYFRQVENGVAVRMGILSLISQ
ncbi:aspartate carbamoyltransferase [Candidatus Peregrinibacteria bacterium]|nr:aspartate carbamoyltransferase [Candidatus Peregrinibacteria bacterium]